MHTITLAEKLASSTSHRDPKVVATSNGNDVMAVRFEGAFPFHDHPSTDDRSPLIAGAVNVDDADAPAIIARPAEIVVLPRGVRHRPRAAAATHGPTIEPTGEPNTGDPATAAPKPRI
ncbi:MAG: mannose-6-phosphate isomerase [Pseudomonadota bacterium]